MNIEVLNALHQSKVCKKSGLPETALASDLVVMCFTTGKYYVLNPTARDMWELLKNPISLEEICVLLKQRYAVEITECREAVTAFLGDLIEEGLIELRP